MKTSPQLVFLAGVAWALACAGTHPPPHFAWDGKADFSALKTYAWYADPAFRMPHGDSIVDGRFLDERIRKAVEARLEGKGYRKADGAGASVYVAYHTDQSGVAGEDEYGVYGWWFPVYVYEGSDYEKERVLTLDVRDSTKRLVWRGQIMRLEGTNPGAVAREIDREVEDLLSNFPPSRVAARG